VAVEFFPFVVMIVSKKLSYKKSVVLELKVIDDKTVGK
jgi:hypothetical protein